MRRDRRHLLSRRRALLLAAGLLALALGLRVGFVAATSYRAVNDAGTYTRFASAIAGDGDYTTGDNGPGTGAAGSRGPTAYFPPAYPYALSLADRLDGHTAGGPASLPGLRLENVALGTLIVGLVGLLALQLAGPGPGLAALGLAAVYPPLIELSGLVVAENLLVALELGAVCAALRAGGAADRGSHPRRWIATTGLLVGLATLAHENAAIMLPALAVPVAATGGPRGGGGRPDAGRTGAGGPAVIHRLAAVGLLGLAAAAVIAPWTVRNALQLHHFVPVSDETGITLRGAYNPASAADRSVPWKWRLFWRVPQDQGVRRRAGSLGEPQLSAVLEHRALTYISAHPGAPLEVGEDNLARMFELEGTAAWHASARAVDLPVDDARIGVIGFWVLCGLAIAGLCTRRARAVPRWVWAVPILFALSVVFVNVETPRFREPIDPFLLVLAGCAVSAATAGVGRRMRSSRA